jgi:hypothetical protein
MADGRLTATPGGVDFQRVAVFDGREAEVTLRNVGRARITVDEIWVEGPGGTYLANFTHEGPHSLLPGSECALKVRFAPMAPGPLPATLVIRSDAKLEPVLRIPLQGTGVDAWARVSPHRLDFGRIEAESSKTLVVTVENPTDMPVEVSTRLVGADKDEFSITPVTLGPGEKRELPLTFSPVIDSLSCAAVMPFKNIPATTISVVRILLSVVPPHAPPCHQVVNARSAPGS